MKCEFGVVRRLLETVGKRWNKVEVLILYHESIVDELHDSRRIGVAGRQPGVEPSRRLLDRDDQQARPGSAEASREGAESEEHCEGYHDGFATGTRVAGVTPWPKASAFPAAGAAYL